MLDDCGISATRWKSPSDKFLFLALLSHVCERFLAPNHTFASAIGPPKVGPLLVPTCPSSPMARTQKAIAVTVMKAHKHEARLAEHGSSCSVRMPGVAPG